MKTLYLVRHAKAVKSPDMPDFDRPLAERGEREALEIAARFKEGIGPDGLVSSPSERSLRTAAIFAEVFGYPADKIMKRKALYDQTDTAFNKVIREMNEKYSRLMLFGHNPSISAFAHVIAPEFCGEIPPGGVVCIEVEAASWKEAVGKAGKVVRT
jgi:phosphohistidine phosphatase